MALTLEDRLSIETDLELIYKKMPPCAVLYRDQIREYIDVGEYGLALDDLAGIYLDSKTPLRPGILALFERLATKMKMRSGDTWRGVAEILSAR